MHGPTDITFFILNRAGRRLYSAVMAQLVCVVALGLPDHATQRGNRRHQTFFCDEESPTTARGRGIRKAPRGGRLREVAPVGGVELERSEAFSLAPAEASPLMTNSGSSHCHASLPSPDQWEKHAGSLEALRVTRPEAVVLAGN